MTQTKYILFLPIFILQTANSESLIDSLTANREKNEWYLGTQFHYGWLWKHRQKIQKLPSVYPYAWEINLITQTKGRKEWHWANNMPSLGFQLLFLNLRNLEIYGNAFHTTPYVHLMLNRGRKSELYIKLGLGLAFYSNYFHVYRNKYNEIISTPVSYSGTFGFTYKHPLNSEAHLFYALNFNHASNASIRQPNLGANIVSASIGIEKRTYGYHYVTERAEYKKWRKSQKYKEWHFFLIPSLAIKQSDGSPREDNWYPMYNFSIHVMKRLRRKLGVTFGFDYTHDESIRHVLKNNTYYQQNLYPIHRYALLGGYEFIFSESVYGSLQTAYYLYDPYKLDFPLYQRYGLKIFPTKYLLTGFFLKTHLFKADGFELLLGLHFKTKNRKRDNR